MSNGTIKSSTIAAEDAIKELTKINTDTMNNQQVELTDTSYIQGMVVAKDTANKMIDHMSEFTVAVLQQANKFTELAVNIEKRDTDVANGWEVS